MPAQVVYGEPGSRLVDQAVTPKALIESGGRLRLHADYYIKKQVSLVSGTSIKRLQGMLGVHGDGGP